MKSLSNKTAPLVSICIATYNRKKLLDKVIASILKQTYSNYELIIVDDGSSDGTDNYIKKFSKKKNLRYIKHEKNKGLAAARNTGIKNSKGAYIAFMDDDDEWIDRNKISKQINIFVNNPDIDCVCTSVKIKTGKKIYNKIISRPKNLKSHILKKNGIFYTPTIMIKKSLVKKDNFFDTNLKRGIDGDFHRNSILRHNERIYFMEDVTTLINEIGRDRITNLESKESLKKNINANLYILNKYKFYFVMYPSALIYRSLIIINTSYKYYIKNG